MIDTMSETRRYFNGHAMRDLEQKAYWLISCHCRVEYNVPYDAPPEVRQEAWRVYNNTQRETRELGQAAAKQLVSYAKQVLNGDLDTVDFVNRNERVIRIGKARGGQSVYMQLLPKTEPEKNA